MTWCGIQYLLERDIAAGLCVGVTDKRPLGELSLGVRGGEAEFDTLFDAIRERTEPVESVPCVPGSVAS